MGLKAAVLGTFPGTYHRCMVVGGLGLLVELGTVMGDKSEMLVCELEVLLTDASEAVLAA